MKIHGTASGVRVARTGGSLSPGTAKAVKAATKRAKKSAAAIKRGQ
jgi:hypothetical protein